MSKCVSGFEMTPIRGLEVVILGVSNLVWFWFHARLVLVLEAESSFFSQNSNPPLALAPLRNLRPFLFVFSSLDRTPRKKWHDPLTTRCLVRCSLQSLQGERESRIGERKPGWFFFLERQTIYGGK
jgi:hypothetical protein